MGTPNQRGAGYWLLCAGFIGSLLAAAITAVVVYVPDLVVRAGVQEPERKVELPAYDYSAWHRFPVQHAGRVKPFESAAAEEMRNITGTSKLDKQDPVAICLSWMLLKGTSPGKDFFDWETYPFLLCDHQGLRKVIYEHLEGTDKPPTKEQLFGKRIAPADLRDSPGLKRLINEAEALREKDREKADRSMTAEQRKAEEVLNRLNSYDKITQKFSDADKPRHLENPFHFVALDRVQEGAWFALSEVAVCRWNNHRWQELMQIRLSQMPQLYLKPEYLAALQHFQDQMKEGKGNQAVEELMQEIRKRNDERVAAFLGRHKGEEFINVTDLQRDPLVSEQMTVEEINRLGEWLRSKMNPHRADRADDRLKVAEVGQAAREAYAKGEDELAGQMKRQVQLAQKRRYHPDDPQFRMLHLNYLENRFPHIYEESAAWQEFPAAKADAVLASYDGLREAYKANEPQKFTEASDKFFETAGSVSQEFADGHYPGVTTLDLELEYNRYHPFMFAWVTMLLAAACYAVSLGFNSRILYVLGYVFFAGSLLFQVFGFYTRIAISGRPPVSNMYETVIWVAFMSALFALALELVYRRKVLVLAGSVAATIGLVLADNMPLALDPKLSPLVPVLRSNYWLTIHVLTIVSSYAGGALAFMTAMISLGLLAFGKPRRETLHLLSQFTYRGMQIAVLLLAAGTFLGGWWAYESWGRFWGWDPKETWALISLVCYVIPLHMRFCGWIKDFGLAVSGVVCFGSIMMSWYGVNFVLGAGLHSYGFGGGGQSLVLLASFGVFAWMFLCCLLYYRKETAVVPTAEEEE